MARYDVYRNPSTHSNTTPFLLNVQADLLENLDTCIVIPFRLRESFAAVRLPEDLIPEFLIDGVSCFLETPNMAAVPRKILKSPVLNLKKETHRITLAIDRLFHGF
jgi:toxin CcdB